jgi:hypothetical protein
MSEMGNNEALERLGAGEIRMALEQLRIAAWKEPSYKTLVNYAAAQRVACDFEGARDNLMQAIAMDRDQPAAWFNLANVESDTGHFAHALDRYETAWELGKHIRGVNQNLALGLAQALLREQRFEQAWPKWELGRFGHAWQLFPGTEPWYPTCSCKHLLVICEGGYGDAFMFSRWLPLIDAEADFEITLMVWRCLAEILPWEQLGVDHVIAKEDGLPADAGFTHTISWMSLPAVLSHHRFEQFPRHTVAQKRPRMRHGTPHIGFCWQAGEIGHLRKFRSIDDSTAHEIAGYMLKDAEVTSLTPGKGLEGMRVMPAGGGFELTQDVILEQDMVVSVDTVVAHMAGYYGVPTLLLLPCNSDWKWFRRDTVDRWYGPHVRYFRNREPAEWAKFAIIEQAQELLELSTTLTSSSAT